MLLVVFALITALLLLASTTSERVHRELDLAPWQMSAGLAGIAIALPMVLWARDGEVLLALSLCNAVAGAIGFRPRAPGTPDDDLTAAIGVLRSRDV